MYNDCSIRGGGGGRSCQRLSNALDTNGEGGEGDTPSTVGTFWKSEY